MLLGLNHILPYMITDHHICYTVGFTGAFSFCGLYAEVFHLLRIDGEMLVHLTETDLLEDLGMRSGIHRKTVLRAIAASLTSSDHSASTTAAAGGGGLGGREGGVEGARQEEMTPVRPMKYPGEAQEDSAWAD